MLYIFAVATQLDQFGAVGLTKAHENHMSRSKLKFLGVGQTWTGFQMKINLLCEALEQLVQKHSKAFVLFVDAYDVQFFGSTKQCFKAWKHYRKKFGTRILISAETWAQIPFITCVTSHLFAYHKLDLEQSGYPFRYLNSGCIMGPSKTVLKALRTIRSQNWLDDQRAWSVYADQHPSVCMIDFKCKLACTWTTIDTPLIGVSKSKPWVNFKPSSSSAISDSCWGGGGDSKDQGVLATTWFIVQVLFLNLCLVWFSKPPKWLMAHKERFLKQFQNKLWRNMAATKTNRYVSRPVIWHTPALENEGGGRYCVLLELNQISPKIMHQWKENWPKGAATWMFRQAKRLTGLLWGTLFEGSNWCERWNQLCTQSWFASFSPLVTNKHGQAIL